MRMSRDWMELGEDDVGILEEATLVVARHGQDEDDEGLEPSRRQVQKYSCSYMIELAKVLLKLTWTCLITEINRY
jgi:hypothetical protein